MFEEQVWPQVPPPSRVTLLIDTKDREQAPDQSRLTEDAHTSPSTCYQLCLW
jgi:hypothetical protein